MIDLKFDGPSRAARTLVLAHGAGAGMDTPFMEAFATGLAAQRVRVARFEFPYMQRRRETGKQSAPDRPPVLRDTWLEVVSQLGAAGLVIGGKSMGGRIATLVADGAGVAAAVCLGYPFHPVGKPDQLRVEHLTQMRTPALILQGERDPFGNRDEVPGYGLPSSIKLHWLADGDHSFKPRKASGRTQEENWQEAMAAVGHFLDQLG
jgi:predicted alpha/beta-hydrolase family hydrolase